MTRARAPSKWGHVGSKFSRTLSERRHVPTVLGRQFGLAGQVRQRCDEEVTIERLYALRQACEEVILVLLVLIYPKKTMYHCLCMKIYVNIICANKTFKQKSISYIYHMYIYICMCMCRCVCVCGNLVEHTYPFIHTTSTVQAVHSKKRL